MNHSRSLCFPPYLFVHRSAPAGSILEAVAWLASFGFPMQMYDERQRPCVPFVSSDIVKTRQQPTWASGWSRNIIVVIISYSGFFLTMPQQARALQMESVLLQPPEYSSHCALVGFFASLCVASPLVRQPKTNSSVHFSQKTTKRLSGYPPCRAHRHQVSQRCPTSVQAEALFRGIQETPGNVLWRNASFRLERLGGEQPQPTRDRAWA
jgi:hypothetical protein